MCAVRKKQLPWNWRSRIEIVRKDHSVVSNCGRGHRIAGSMTFELLFKKGQTPKGFRTLIGDLDVSDEAPYFVESAGFSDYFCRRGLGTLLYVHALNELGTLTTHYHSASEGAQGLWRSLVRTHNHKIDFFAGTITVFRKGGSKCNGM